MQSVDSLTALAAAGGSVSVVQEQRCARPEVAAGAFGDCRYAGLGRIDDAVIPAAKAVAEAADGVVEPGTPHPVRSAKQTNRRPTRGRGDRLLGREQLRPHARWGAEGEQAVVEAVVCDLVTVFKNLPEEMRVLLRVCAEDEEGRPMAALG